MMRHFRNNVDFKHSSVFPYRRTKGQDSIVVSYQVTPPELDCVPGDWVPFSSLGVRTCETHAAPKSCLNSACLIGIITVQ